MQCVRRTSIRYAYLRNSESPQMTRHDIDLSTICSEANGECKSHISPCNVRILQEAWLKYFKKTQIRQLLYNMERFEL
jgi:hypothetical protein